MDVNQPTATAPLKKKRLGKKIRIAMMVAAALIVTLLVARRQIGNLLARQLDARLAAAGVYVGWKSADWVAGPGIRLRDLAIYRDAGKRERIAMLGNVTAFKANRGWSQWDRVNVQMKDSLFLLGQGSDETALEHVNLQLAIRKGAADLLECDALLRGLRINAKGTYVRPAPLPETEPESGGLFENLDMAWLKPLREWVDFHPRSGEPVLHVDFHSREDGSATALSVSLDGRAFQWRGQEWDLASASLDATFGGEPAPVIIHQIKLGAAGKTLETSGSYDIRNGRLHVVEVQSEIDPLLLARSFAPDLEGTLSGISASGDWRIGGQGVFGIGSPADNHFEGGVALDGEFLYSAENKRVTLHKPSFGFKIDGRDLIFSAFKAGLWDGDLVIPSTRITLPSDGGGTRFTTEVSLERARLQSIASSFGSTYSQPGTLRCTWNGGGEFDPALIQGGGSLRIDNAEFYRIPLLGPLHLVFDRITPGFGRDVASTLTCSHELSENVLHIRNLHVGSKLTSIDGGGSIDFTQNHAEMTAKAKLQGLAGKATALISSLLEVEGSGPPDDMHWRLKNTPDSRMVTDAAKSVGEAGGAVIEGTGNVLKSTGRTARGLLKIPGKLFSN